MKSDKNSLIGFVLLGILFFSYFWYTNQQQTALVAFKKQQEDSIAKAQAKLVKPQDVVAAKIDSLQRDSIAKIATAGNFAQAAIGKDTTLTLENELIRVVLTNKGGQVKNVTLKKYTTSDSASVVLGQQNQMGYAVNTADNKTALTSELYFTPSAITSSSDGSSSIRFVIASATGTSIIHTYTLHPNSYAIDWDIELVGANQLLTAGVLNFKWLSETSQLERTAEYERQMSNICFSEGNEFDYISANNEKTFEKPVQWVSVVQQFFNTTLIAKSSFNSGAVNWSRYTDSSKKLAKTETNLQIKLPLVATNKVALQLFNGPSDFEILKKQAPEMDRIVNLGRDMYSFVRPINKYIIMPVFDFFAGFVSNYGWVVLLLTLFIRLVTSPLTYSSYLSGAKMKVLKPELDTIKKKFGDDQQGFAMEQMKLFREAGVNPLGGCIPALLQIPIFFALYS